jgi:hypothetical protein
MNPLRYLLAATGMFVAASGLSAETRRLPVVADVGICAHRAEKHWNTGADHRVRIKGIEHYYLFDVDTSPVRSWRITSATLRLKLARGRPRRLAVSTVPIAWPEGSGRGRPQANSSCFTHVRYPDRPWTPWGGTILDATFNHPQMRFDTADARIVDGWVELPVDPALVQALSAGLSRGLLVSEETGLTWENHDIYTREQANARPVLEVTGQPGAVRNAADPPAGLGVSAEPAPRRAGADYGALRVQPTWPAAGPAVLGGKLTLRIHGPEGVAVRTYPVFTDKPLWIERLPPGGRCDIAGWWLVDTGHDILGCATPPVTVRASEALDVPPRPVLPAAGRQAGQAVGPAGTLRLHPVTTVLDPRTPAPREASLRPAATARNAWVGWQGQWIASGDSPPDARASFVWDQPRRSRALTATLYRLGSVPAGDRWPGEVAVPLGSDGRLRVDRLNGRIAGRRTQPMALDIWVPPDAPVGRHTGQLIVRPAAGGEVSLPIHIDVADTALPDRLSIIGEMNTYGSPARRMGVRLEGSGRAFYRAEHDYHRLAHAHRMTLNIVPYNQKGEVHDRAAPTLRGRGGELIADDWSHWDARYGPLLSGQAFSAEAGYVGPGAGTPIHHMYLPLHENWPASLEGHFSPWPPPDDWANLTRWLAQLPPLAECFSAEHKAAWHRALTLYRDHVQRRGWTDTNYQVYLNNKVMYRDSGRFTGRGISLWTLDEPMFADDFRALAHFGRRVRRERTLAEARGANIARLVYRVDLSRPTHQRTWLDGVVDLNVCADQLVSQRRWIAYRKAVFSERYQNYRMPPSFGAHHLGWAIWPVRSRTWGAEGTLVWQTLGSDGDLDKADPTALLYPGRKLGVAGPVASIRMKAWRQGLQDAQLLEMLAARHDWSDRQLRAWVAGVLGLSGWRDETNLPDDAPVATFHGVTPAALGRLRSAALFLLDRDAVGEHRP